MMKRMRKVMALFVVVAMLFNLCPLSATADVRRNNIPASLGNANIQSSNDDKGDKSATNQGATDAQAKNENKAASDTQAKSENKDTTDTKTKIDKEEDASDSTQIQADTSASEKTEETTATEKAADNKEASTEAVTDSTEASSTEVINDSEASTTETDVTNDEGKAQSEKDDDKAETKDEKSDKKDDEDKEEKMPAFSETKSIDGVKITVSADKDVFPKGVTLSIRKVSKADGKNVDKAIDKIREDGVNVAAAYTFDIKIVDKDGNEIQPVDGKKVRVGFEAEEVGNDNLTADIYHITGKGKKLTAEMLDSDESADKVTASTGGFSLYTVEFTYDEIQYVMEGDTSVALTDILDEVGLTGKVTEVEVSDESLFSAKKKDGEWMVTANKAFSSTEWMKVTIDGVVYEIVVTDAQTYKYSELTVGQVLEKGTSISFEGAEGRVRFYGNDIHEEKVCSSFVFNSNGKFTIGNDVDDYYPGANCWSGSSTEKCLVVGLEKFCNRLILMKWSGSNEETKVFHVEFYKNSEFDSSDLLVDSIYDINNYIVSGNQLLINWPELDTQGEDGKVISKWECRFYEDYEDADYPDYEIISNVGASESLDCSYYTVCKCYPVWTDYKVVFDMNGNSNASWPSAFPDGGTVTLPTINSDSEFMGWSTDPYPTDIISGSSYQRPDSVKDSVITLYANWDSIRKLKYNANGGTFISNGTDTYEDPKNPYDWTYPTSGSGIATILDGDKLTHPEGKSFKEWNTKADCTGTTYTAGATLDLKGLTYNTVLYAQWESAEPAASVTSGSTTTDYGDFSAAVSAWNSAESGATLKLIANVTTGSTVSVSGTKTLDLNGYGIKMTGSGSVISVTGGASLTLKDSNTNNVTHRFTIADPSEKGAGLATVNDALESGYKTFMGGYITGGSASQGGGVYVAGGTFNMTGGNIIGNKTTAKGYYEGGGVALSNNTDSRFVMTGGTIQYNTSIGRGGGLGIENNATADLSGDAKIMYNRSTDNDWGGGISSFGTLNISGNVKVMYNKGGSAVHPQQGSINVSGSPVIYDNEVSAGNILPDVKINVAGTLAELAKFGIYYGNAGVFTTGDNAADYASNFVSDNDNFVVGKNADGQLYLGVPVAVSFNTNDGSTVESQTVASGSMVTKPDDPTKEGYAFVGWYKESTFTTEWDFDRDTVTEVTTIYAKWKQAYSVTLTGGANSSASPSDKTTQTGLTGAMTTVTYTANDGYYFGELTTVLSRNGITVTRADDGKTITVSGTSTADVNITIPDAVAMRTYVVTLSIGYNYENYTVSGGALSQTVSGAIEPVTFTANDGYYFLTEYTTHTHNGLTAKVDEDSVVSFLNTPDGYTTSTVITVSGTPTSDVSWIVASKPVPGYTVTINGGGNATPSGETTYSLMSGNLPTVIYTPNEGYHFERFDDIVKDDIKVTWSSEQEVAVFGYVGSDVEITVPDAISNDAGKVTFKVKNGSWDDGNEADIEVDLENSRIPADKIPTVGSKPAEGYKEGSWDTEPSTDTAAITADTTYTYTYIKKTSITPTVSISDWTYGGTASTPSVNGNTGNGEVTYTYAKKGTTAFSSDVPSDVGEYTVKAVVAETDNYLGGEATADFTIVKAEVTAPAITEKHYTGKTQTADVEASDLYTVTTNNGGTDVGSYDVVLTLKDAVNYRWADDEAATKLLTFKIVSADTNTVTVSIDGWTYGDSAKTPTVTADFGADTAAYTYSSSENGEYSTDVPTDAGTWYVKASIPEMENYPAGEAKTSFVISKAEVTAPAITEKHYTGKAQTADVEASDLYTVTTNNGGTDVGSYDVVLTLKDAGNYKWTDSEEAAKTLTFKIVTATANNVTVDIEGWTYGEAAKTPTATADFGADTATYTYSDTEDGEYSATVPTDAGTRYVKASIPATDNYPAGEAKTSFTIAKAEVTAPAITDKHYTGEAQTADVEASDLYTVTTNNGGTKVGSYDVVLTLKDTTNYKWTDSEDATKTLTFKIVPKDANIVTVSIEGWTFGEATKTPTSTADFGADTATYTYSSSENGEYSADVPTDAGIWYVKASVAKTEDYPAGEDITSFVIAKAKVIAPAIANKNYTGDKQTADVEASDLYTVTTNNGGTDVGSYDVVLTLKDAVNYKWTDSEEAAKTLTFKIVTATANNVTISIAGWTYGEAAKTPTATADFGADTVTYTYSSSENGEYSADAPAEAGTWYVKASIPATDNYPAGEAKTSFVISKAEVTAPAITEKHYTGKAQTADVEASDLYTVTTNNGGTDVGSYDVVLTLKDAVNYKWTDSEDAAKTLTFKIVPEDANIVTVNIDGWTYGEEAKAPKVTADFGADTATYTYSSSENGEYSDTVPTDAGTWYVKANIEATDDYSAGEAKNSFVIEPAAITIMADDKSTIYNEELAELTYTIGGSYVEDDDLGITLSTTAAKGSEPGDYPITVSWKENPNYDAALEDGQYTITKGGVSITVSGYSGKYDGKAHGITVKELEGESGELIGIFDGDSPEATVYYSTKELGKNNYKDDGSKELLTFTDAGKYTVYYYVQCKGYTIDPISGSKTVEITKVPLKVTAKDATITYGDKPDNNGVEYSGFVNDETKKVLKGTLSYNIDYEQYGDVGSSYSITPKGVTAKNYDITFVSGKLKVNPKKLTFTWDDADKTYNGKKQSVTAKAKTINDDVLTLTYSDNEKKNAGKYTAKITGVEGQKAANYKLSDDESTASCDWEIAKKKMSVTAKDVSVEYDEKEYGIEVKVTDPKSGYTITYGKEKGEYDSRKSPTITKEGSLTVYFKVEADNYITYIGSAKVTVKEKKEGTSSSSVEVKEGTPSVSVNGLDEEAKALQEGESADVNVTMSVEQVAEGSEGGDGITAIRNIAEGRMLTFFDIKVIKDVDSVKTVMDTTTNILEICIPYYHISEEGLAAYRYHGSSATRLTESDSRQDGTYRVDKITKKVYIYTNQFSIYAIGYTVKSSVNEEGDTVYDISGNIRYEDIDGMANLILYRNGEECKRGIAAFTGGVGTYQFEELKEGNYSLRITMDAGKDSFTLEIPIGDVSKQVVE